MTISHVGTQESIQSGTVIDSRAELPSKGTDVRPHCYWTHQQYYILYLVAVDFVKRNVKTRIKLSFVICTVLVYESCTVAVYIIDLLLLIFQMWSQRLERMSHGAHF